MSAPNCAANALKTATLADWTTSGQGRRTRAFVAQHAVGEGELALLQLGPQQRRSGAHRRPRVTKVKQAAGSWPLSAAY